MINLIPVRTRLEWKEFIHFPWRIYERDPNWVPPLKTAVRELLNVKKNPFFQHATMELWLAWKDKKCVGRIAGIIDQNHNLFHQEKTAFFGFFESFDDLAIARGLLDAVKTWACSHQMNRIRGPMNPSINHECGLLVEGYQDSPTVMMTYNPPFYQTLLEKCGLKKSMDLFAYDIRSDTKVNDKILSHAERLRQNGKVTFRTVNLKKFDQEVQCILDIYNDAWEKNWGFVPMTPQEFFHLAKDLKAVLDPKLLLIAEVGGKPAGFALTLPDVNQAIKKIRNGKLFPTGLVKLLWNLKGPGRKKTITRCRILTLGIKKEFRDLGIGPLLYTEYLKRGPELGYHQGEASWVLEDNIPMNRALMNICGTRTKTYRIFDATI